MNYSNINRISSFTRCFYVTFPCRTCSINKYHGKTLIQIRRVTNTNLLSGIRIYKSHKIFHSDTTPAKCKTSFYILTEICRQWSVDDKALSKNYNCKNWTYFSICHWGVIVEMESFETWIYSLQFMTTKIWDPE